MSDPTQPAASTPPEPDRPTIADGKQQQLDPRVVTTWRIGSAIAVAFLSGVLLIATLILAINLPAPLLFRFAVLPAVWLAVVALLGCWAFFWPEARYRHTFYRVFPAGLEIRRGVIWRVVIHVPKTRVQHTDVNQGPIERAFGLATLIIYTAGTEHASVALIGLERDTAFRIRDHLIPKDADDAV